MKYRPADRNQVVLGRSHGRKKYNGSVENI
jgi:hypothetical protein